MKYRVIAMVDTNDGDYVQRDAIIDEKALSKARDIYKKVKGFQPYEVTIDGIDWTHESNWPVGECRREDLGEKSPQELYNLTYEEIEFFETIILPYSEYGFHTIVSIEYFPYTESYAL